MRWRMKYVAIATLLTVLDAVVTVDYGKAVWAAWSSDLLARGLLVFLAAVGAMSLANVWAQAGSNVSYRAEDALLVAAERRGPSDV